MPNKTAHLIELSKDTSPAGRARLVDETANELLHQPRDFSDRELQLFGQIFSKLYEHTHPETRHQLANVIALSDWAPISLVRAVAMDTSPFAGPVISFSPILTDEILCEIVEQSTLENQLRVAERPNIGSLVTNSLVDKDQIRIVEALSKNSTALITEAALEKALFTAKSQPHILDKFTNRLKASPHLMKLAADFGSSAAQIELPMLRMPKEIIKPANSNDARDTQSHFASISASPKYIRELIHVGDRAKLMEILAQHMNMTPNQMAGILAKNKIEHYALLARSIGLDPSNVEDMVNLLSNFTIEWRSEYNKAMISLWVKYSPAFANKQFISIA